MSQFSFHAADMLRRPVEARSEALRLSMLCAFGQLSLDGRTPLCRDSLGSGLKGFVALNPSQVLLPGILRVVVSWAAKTAATSAVGEIEVLSQRGKRRDEPQVVKVIYPDELLGLEQLLGEEPRHRVAGLYFNLTPGEVVGNLFGAIAPLCAAFALMESLRAESEPEALLTR